MSQPSWCTVCRTSVNEWEPNKDGQPQRCPHCGSLGRHRLLAYTTDQLPELLNSAEHVVDVAPSIPVTRFLRSRIPRSAYVRADLGLDDRTIDLQADLTRLSIRSASVDLMIVFHVLEHIPDDGAAMREIGRVIGDRGLAVLHVPWRPKQPTEEGAHYSPGERTRRLGQVDHVRLYGRDFEDRLRAAGLTVSRWESDRHLERGLIRSLRLPNHLWLVTGVADDPTDPDEHLAALLARRRGRFPVRRLGRDVDAQARDAASAELELDLLRDRVREAENRIDEAYRSWSFRVGWTVLAPTRWVRRRSATPPYKARRD